ncbi:uncharacterized protein JCM6883_003502 [Sporobolomyces salmoneus]|uniref:uncharacterized protein n=1 Tax=Sporobolomyces salmoneus TaxID=183962 RepID=UPI00317A2E87
MTIDPSPPASGHSTRRSTSSAFSRLANIALSTSSSTSTSTSTSSPSSAPSPVSSGGGGGGITSFPLSSTNVTQTSVRGGALDALESIANADVSQGTNAVTGGGGRKRLTSTDSNKLNELNSTNPNSQSTTGGGGTNSGVTRRFNRSSWNTGNRMTRDESTSRSRERERERERERSDSSASGFQGFSHHHSGGNDSSSSPYRTGGGGGGGTTNGGYWGASGGGENRDENGSHFFQPGAGSSGFSFELPHHHHHHSSSGGNGGNGGGGVGSFWDGSYRSSITGSPSLFGTSTSRNNSTSSGGGGGGGGGLNSHLSSTSRYPWSNEDTTSTSSPSASAVPPLPLPIPGHHHHQNQQQRPPLSRAQSPTSQLNNLARSSSPLGGGRKLKEFSRGLSFSLSSSVTSTSGYGYGYGRGTGAGREGGSGGELEKGLIGIAKPRKNGIVQTDLGRVAVAGKHSLRILKVPHGPFLASTSSSTRRPPTKNSSSYANVARSSSIADRRSRSRGPKRSSPSSGGSGSASASSSGFIGVGATTSDGIEDEGTNAEGVKELPEMIEELMDVRQGSRLSPSYLFQDVRWGYGATSNKLATACTNGAVILWDLSRDSASSKLDQVKYEHDRAVNRIVFGGQTGNWLMSGGQDGQMKLWDIRESRPSSMILKASSPVRHLSFSPSASQPFTLLAACASGTLIRYDVRYISRQNGGATDRIAGHIGSCLAMDWRDGFDCERLSGGAALGGVGVTRETAGGGKEGGWVVTGGIDSTIKIWDFSLPTLATKQIRTLYPSQPVQSVSWHPTNGTELASSPLPSLSLGSTVDSKGDDSTNRMELKGDATGQGGRGSSWKNEISIWDTRRPYFPKLSIKTEEPSSSILFNDDETIWSTSKTSTTFNQYDTASDSYSLLDCIDRPSTAWNLEGDFMFVDDSRTPHDIPFERSRAPVPVNSDKYIPDVYFASVTDLDPDFSSESFTQLANNLKLVGDFDELCEHNIHVSFLAGRPDAAQVWAVIKTWFGRSPLSAPDTPPLTPPITEDPVRDDDRNRSPSPPPAAAPDWILSPTSTTHSDSVSKGTRHHRFSLSSLRSSPSSRRQTSSDTFDSSTTALPKESIKQLLDTFSEESTASETDPSTQSPYYPELSSTSSDSEEPEIRSTSRRMHKSSLASLPTNRLAASLAALADSQQHGLSSTELSLDDVHKHPSRTPSRLGSRRNSSSSAVSSESSDSSLDENDGPGALVGGGDSTARKSSRASKIAALHASLIANRSRRPSAGNSTERRPLRSRDSSTLAGRKTTSRKQSAEGNSKSRRGSAARMAPNRTMSTVVGVPTNTATKEESKTQNKTMTSKDLSRQAAAAHADEAFEIVKQQLRATLIDYADRGDSQLCAVVCCVLREQDLGFDSLWVARVTKAYLDMLRRLDLHVPAATLNKYCATESLRNLTQDSVVFHTACGRCGKGIEQPPFDYCQRCRMIITRCGICHLAVTSLYVFCACCGHGLHETCLHNFAGSHSAISQPQTPNTVPSTPGIATPLRNWLFREDSSIVDSVTSDDELEGQEGRLGDDAAERLAILLSHCPSACSHPC